MSLAYYAAREPIPITSNERIEELESEFDEIHSDLFKGRCWPLLFGSMPYLSTKNRVVDPNAQNQPNSLSCITNQTIIRNKISEDPRIDYDKTYKREKPVLWFPVKEQRKSQFKCLQKWRGVVLEVFKDSFSAKLEDLSENTPDEIADILLAEISDEDLNLVKPGSVFYWSIGYHVNPSGQRQRSSIIRLRRLPVWTASELAEAKNKAAKFKSIFGISEKK